MPTFTPEQAREIIQAHEIDSLLTDEIEADLLRANNPELYEAYMALLEFAGMTA